MTENRSKWIQGVLSGGLDSWDLQIWGAPFLPPLCGKTLALKGVGANIEAKMGRPKFADPTPHGSNPPLTIGAKIVTLHNLIVSNSFPRLCNNFLHYRIGFALFPRLCNFWCCFKVYHVDIGLHYIIAFELISWLCNLSLHYRSGFELTM